MARGKQNQKPTRNRKRLRSTSPKSESNDSCPFLSLPIELIDAIVQDVPYVHSLILTCRAFYYRYHLRSVVEYFGGYASLRQVYCLEGAEDGDFGWKPFTILSAEFLNMDDMDDGDLDCVFLACLEHNVDEFRKVTPTRDYLGLEMNRYGLFLDFEYNNWINNAPQVYHEWDDIRGRLRRATPALLKERFGPCPECKGRKLVLYGSRDVAQR